jgi:tetratricopeptide (TPR) repeat protein
MSRQQQRKQQVSRGKLAPIPASHISAQIYWQNKLESAPENPRVHRNLAPLLEERAQRGERGAAAQAMRHLKKGALLDPNSAIMCNDFALALLKAGRVDKAIEELTRGLKLDPNSAIIRKNLSAAFAKKGSFFSLYSPKKWLYSGHIHITHPPYMYIYVCITCIGKFKDALEHAHEASRLDPNDAQSHRNIAKILDAMGNTRDSLEVFDITQ